MSQSKPNKHEPHAHNDGCQNCIRQKKQNQALIKVYQRLQEVDKKTNIIKKAVFEHKHKIQTNRSFYKSYESKLINLPKMKINQSKIQVNQNVGFQIAANILEKDAKNKLLEEQRRLKELLLRMQKQKSQAKKPAEQTQSIFLKRNIFQTNTSTVNQSTISFLDTNSYDFKRQTDQIKNLQKSMISQDTFRQNGSTQSTSFNTTKLRNSVDLNKYNDLNLWLYENQKNTKLQQELFITKKMKNQSFSVQKPKVNLPFIRQKK